MSGPITIVTSSAVGLCPTGAAPAAPSYSGTLQGLGQEFVLFDDMGISAPFVVSAGAALVLRRYADSPGGSDEFQVELVQGCGEGTLHSPMVLCGCDVTFGSRSSMLALVIPGSYRIRCIGGALPLGVTITEQSIAIAPMTGAELMNLFRCECQ
jgi:hypothetical protein